jgi:AAA family ATP:ADP antiporter
MTPAQISTQEAVGTTHWILLKVVDVRAGEVRALLLAFVCNFTLMGSYYLLRPVRDAMATVFGVDQLHNLFTGTLILTLLCSPTFAWLTDNFKLSKVIPGVFWFLIVNLLAFYGWFITAPESRTLAAGFYWWFSVVNLFMVSVFWSLIVDVFTSGQAARLLPAIAAGGSSGAIAGPLLASLFVKGVGVSGVLLMATVGFALVIVIMHRMIAEKDRLLATHDESQGSTLDHKLTGSLFDGFKSLFTSSFQLHQAAFMFLMTWIATIGYFLQTDLISKAFPDVASRTQALADIDLMVNIVSAAVALFGLNRFIARFGVTGSLVLNPILMAISFVLMALSPTLIMLQAMQVLRRVTQYAIARPSREICFTVVEQENRYKAKNLIDVVVYRFGDLSSAWGQAGLRALGFGVAGALGLGVAVSGLWGVSAWILGRRYEQKRATLERWEAKAHGMPIQ